MRAKAIRSSFVGCPPSILAVGFTQQSQVPLCSGDTYEIHGVSVYSGVVFLLVINAHSLTSWLPAWLFEQVDNSIPSDWITSLFDDEPRMLVGPDFIAGSMESYSRFVEQEPEAIQQLWQRIDAMKVDKAD